MTSRHSFKARARKSRRRGVSRNVLFMLLAGLVLSSFSVLGLLLYMSPGRNHSDELETALRMMRKGDGEASARLASSISPKALKRKDISKREFIIGVNERKTAEGIAQRRIATERNERAVKHLQKSKDLEFPDGYEGQGNYYLGMALFDLFRWDEAETPLEVASERWPMGRADSIERLVDIDLSFAKKDSEAALARIAHWRTLPRTSKDEEERTSVKEMQALYVAGEFLRAAALLDGIPEDSPLRPEGELLAGRCLHRIAEMKADADRMELLRSAAKRFQKVLDSPKPSVDIRRQSNLELGRVQRDLNNWTQALSTFSALRLSSPYEPESLVSGLEEIDTLILLERFADAVDTISHINKNFGELKWYQNDWMPLSEMRKKVVASGEKIIDKDAFEPASRFSDSLPPMCDAVDRLRMRSRLYELWALQGKSQRLDDGLVGARHKTAAEAYELLARNSRRSPQYNELLRRAIDNYRLAGAFPESNKLIEHYMLFEPRENQPVGYLIQARNYKSMDMPDKAMESLQRLLDSNTSTSLVYDARLEAARIHASKDEFQEAEELIVQNLYYGDLKPESPIWRDSLYELGNLLFRRGEMLQSQARKAMAENSSRSLDNFAIMEQSYNELKRSTARMEESMQRFENDPRRIQMLYTTAKAYQLAAVWPDLLLRENRIANEDTIASWKAQRKDLLRQSRSMFSKLREEITASPDLLLSNTNVEDYLRNAFFGEADLLYDTGDYEEAMAAYQNTANRYIKEPEAMEAMVQIANCQKQLGRYSDSRRTLETAKALLEQISPDKDQRFKVVTSHNRAGWEQFINWLIDELDKKDRTSSGKN